jgi:cytochrome b involved in lipid metabolism
MTVQIKCPFASSREGAAAAASVSPFGFSGNGGGGANNNNSAAPPPPRGTADAAAASAASTSSSANNSNDNSNTTEIHQAWRLVRPQLAACPKLTRRQARQINRSWTLADVAAHRYADDAWIAVAGRVYDITEHVACHPGWDSGCGISTVLSILAAAGTDCTAEFDAIHAPYPEARRQLAAFYIGDLAVVEGDDVGAGGSAPAAA